MSGEDCDEHLVAGYRPFGPRVRALCSCGFQTAAVEDEVTARDLLTSAHGALLPLHGENPGVEYRRIQTPVRQVTRRQDGGVARARRPRPAQERLSALGARLAQDFGVDGVRGEDGWPSVHVVPRAGACPLYWVASDDELVFGMGEGGCRWELSHEAADIDFLEAAVEAAVAGRVVEVFGPGRSQLTVHLSDGVTDRTSQATAPAGCLPVPFWTRSPRHRREYVPYRE